MVMSRGFMRPDSRGTLFSRRDEDKTKRKPNSSSRSNHFSEIQPQNVKQARVYVFGNTDMHEDELNDTVEMSDLRSRVPPSGRKGGATAIDDGTNHAIPRDKEEVLEKEIMEGDTLQSVALQYGCQVSELKRLNKLIQDQEFFALKVIKVPVRRHGLLTELIAQENSRSNGPKLSLRRPNTVNDTIIGVDDINYEGDSEEEGASSEIQSLLVRTLSIRDVCNNPSKDAKDFLKNMDQDLEKIRSSTKSYKDSLEEVAKTLTCKRIYPIKKSAPSIWNGADCGLGWWTVVLIMLVIGLLAPLTYFLYFEFGKPPD